ncbi:hypothetical protein [uncultured Clostridium sp.]|jgi:hypothetical protein|uniref:hypothetical protein n=1 Tax=uncultured Clostridium sp. TaxID=59620 RepID=UPI0026278936|nr:hypothetical protein [uncultured Clostridium sp.]
MKKNIIIGIIAAALLVGIAGTLIYMKKQNEPKPKKIIEVHKIVTIKPKVKKIKPLLDYGIHFLNEKDFPYFMKYKASVLPFIKSQYPTNFVVDITIDSVKMNNWKMEIFYSAKITESNYYSYTQKSLNYSCNVRSNIPIESMNSYQKTNSTIANSHYSIPAGSSYLTITKNNQTYIQFLVNGLGLCNSTPDINTSIIANQGVSTEPYNEDSETKPAPYIYSIIDSDGVTDTGFINAGASTVKYTLKSTKLEKTNQKVYLPANTKLYFYPSQYSKEIVSTNTPIETTATSMLKVSKNKYMYLVTVQGQEGWVLL